MNKPYLLIIEGQSYGFYRSVQYALSEANHLFPNSDKFAQVYDERSGLAVLVEETRLAERTSPSVSTVKTEN